MNTLSKIVRDRKIKELQEYLNDNKEIVINQKLFIGATLNKTPANGGLINKEGGKIVYPILHHCIKHDRARCEKGERLSFQDVMKILYEAVHDYITLETSVMD